MCAQHTYFIPIHTQEHIPSGAYFEDIPKMTASATKNEKLVMAKQMKVFLCLFRFPLLLGGESKGRWGVLAPGGQFGGGVVLWRRRGT